MIEVGQDKGQDETSMKLLRMGTGGEVLRLVKMRDRMRKV